MTVHYDFAGKQVLVTGGTSGIGLGICEAFVAAKADVIGVGVGKAEVEGASARLPDAKFHELDVRKIEAVERFVESLESLDVCINCAGIIRRDQAEYDPSNFADVVSVNLTGTANVCLTVRKRMPRGASIINMASMYSYFGSAFVPAYSASKGGIAQLTKSFAIGWAKYGIRVNAVAPGWIETPLTQPLRDDSERNRAILERTPMERWGTPADVASVVLFLAGPAASFVTGTVIPVDGGYSIA